MYLVTTGVSNKESGVVVRDQWVVILAFMVKILPTLLRKSVRYFTR